MPGRNPWDRNEGKFDQPSSAPPGKVATARPAPQPVRRDPPADAFDLGAAIVRVVTVDEIPLPAFLRDDYSPAPPPVKKYDAAPGRRLKRKDR